MSFASTPLGQGRRLDHHTFLKGPSVNPTQIHGAAHGLRAHPQRQSTHKPPVSYAYGAPSQSTRSPPKPTKSEATTNVEEQTHASDSDQPALIRYARLKQVQESNQNQNIADAPRVSNKPPNPDRWSVKDTSVNIASAFHRAANSTIIPAHDSSASNTSSSFNNSSIMNPNDSWASGMQRRQNLPRSTSVEYEKETQSTVNRRLGAPPNRNTLARPQKPATREPPLRTAPEEAREEQESTHTTTQRTKGPLDHIVEATRRLAPATFLMRRQSEEPEPRPAPGVQDKSSSYDYSAEEREFRALSQQEQAQRKATNAASKRNRMSTDNKAYLPSQSDPEDSDEDWEDDGKKGRRRKKKTGAAGGPLTSLPVAGYDKRKKKRRGAKGAEDEEESSEEEDQSYEHVTDERSGRTTSFLRTSVPPPSRRSVPRSSVPPEVGNTTSFLDALDVEDGLQPTLHSIIEEDESAELDDSVEVLSQQSFSIGAVLGRVVHAIFSLFSVVMASVWSAFTYLPFLCGRALGYLVEFAVLSPARRLLNINTSPLVKLSKYLTVGLGFYAAWYALNSGLIVLPSRPTYTPPYRPPADIPPTDLSELSSRLLRLENVLSGLSLDIVRLREDTRTQHTQLGTLEHQLHRDSSQVYEVQSKFSTATQGLQAVQQEVRSLHAQVVAQKERELHQPTGPSADEEARRLLRELEQRVGTVEGGVKEALEVGKHASSDVPAGKILEWWNKLASGKTSSLTIKTSDGKDVIGVINQLVDSAVSKMSKDTLARPDFAMYSSGASVVPSLTSETFEIKPQGLTSRALGLVTGNGYAVGRPPVTALHHETHNGHCWPFAGDQGQLGVMLSMPAYISDVTIDHVAKEVATDMRSAPRHMELWGLIEGEENTAKFNTWKAFQAAQKEEACSAAKAKGEECAEDQDGYPKTLPSSVPYMRITNFTYNIYAPNHIQTFPVPQEIQDLGIDFGVVVLVVKSNWGREDFTCLYRVRVHGGRLGSIPEPLPEEAAS
ncbi:hypothetical protein PHLGIDRAFT_125098 [Phlebiopsis gigantea 11061_1 CR5-6]|uniref:SUN domain-containing protein n=1 Tax=Phlebiopsis gigantea (strain 11061_1 CR5-6) TaxID=745531 RepID=A0A0C3SCU3_PHLG1|nr:hypothetical protein PHLGIDRAFT_125098 [Phlebiopsis gigantea 11061_1 CR5-6]